MLSTNKLQPFIEGDAQIVARAAADGTIVGFDTEVESGEVSSIMSDVQDEYDEFIEDLGDILYTNSGVDRAYQFGKLLRSGVEDRTITEDQFLQMVDFDEVNTDETRLFVKFSELYPDGDYPDGTNPKVAGVLADEHSAQKAREINKTVVESDYQFTDKIAGLWYNTSEYTISTVSQRVGESDVKRPLDAVSLIYLLGGETPPSEVKIKSHLPEPDAVVDSSDSDSDTLTLTKVSDNESIPSKNSSNESHSTFDLGDNPTIEDFRNSVKELREKYVGSRLDYELGSLVRELADEYGISVSDMADTDVIDITYSHLNKYRHAVGPFTKDTYPSDIAVSGLYGLVNEYEDNGVACKRITSANSFGSTTIHNQTINYFKSVDEVDVESAVEEISGRSTEDVVARVQMVHILDGQQPPEKDVVYDTMGESPPSEVGVDDSTETDINHSEQDDSAEQGDKQLQPEDEVTDDTNTHHEDTNEEHLRGDIADSFIDTRLVSKIIKSDSVEYDPDTQTLIPESPDIRKEIESECGKLIPSNQIIGTVSDVVSDSETRYSLVDTSKQTPSGITEVEDIDGFKSVLVKSSEGSTSGFSEGIYDVTKRTDNPLLITHPDDDEKVALAIEAYASHGGETVVYVGEQTNNGQTPQKTIQALHNNFTIDQIVTGVQWYSRSDALYVFTKHTNTEDTQ